MWYEVLLEVLLSLVLDRAMCGVLVKNNMYLLVSDLFCLLFEQYEKRINVFTIGGFKEVIKYRAIKDIAYCSIH